MNVDPKAILKFWFVETQSEQWFKKDDEFDALIADNFGDVVVKALNGDLSFWAESDEGLLALIIILDQFTRNIYRGSTQSFAGDEVALALSLEGQKRGLLKTFNKHERHFLLVPMMHSEDLAIQDASLPLYKEFTDENTYGFAVAHRDIVAEFGRFPHRNEILDRSSSDDEIEFLKQPGSSF